MKFIKKCNKGCLNKKIIVITAVLVMALSTLTGCGGSKLKDGYYTAQTAEFEYGWKEYLCIQVKNGNIVSAEFNAKNESGFIKAWDNNYMNNMMSVQDTYPNKYTREYIQQLINEQQDVEVDIVSGASTSGGNFIKLVDAVLKQAEQGDSDVVIVR